MTDETREFVYAIGHPEGFVKIGRSKDPQKRLKSHQVSSPYDLWIIAQFPAVDSRELEGELHESFEDRHVRGEWFKLDSNQYDDLVELMQIANGNGVVIGIDDLEKHRRQARAALL